MKKASSTEKKTEMVALSEILKIFLKLSSKLISMTEKLVARQTVEYDFPIFSHNAK